jgi:hypothetical protein
MKITVAICTWNRSALLAKTLELMTALVIPPDAEWEVLIVDNNCTDDTVPVARRFESRLPIRIVQESQPGASYARNRALRAANGEYLLFTDDDVLVDKEWIARFAAAARRFPDATAFGGRIEPWFPEPPDEDFLAAFPELRMGFCALNYDRPEGPLQPGKYLYTANMGLQLARLNGIEFNKDLGPHPNQVGLVNDDTAFIDQLHRHGHQVIWVPTMHVRHYVDPSRMTLRYLLNFSVGKGRTEIRDKGLPIGVRCFGVPRWLLRRYAEARAQWLRARLAGHRGRALEYLGQSARLRGMISECRRLHRAQVAD